MYKILVILILILIISFLTNKTNKINNNTEDFTEDFTSIESIQNLTAMYNNQKLTSTRLEITNDASFNNININGQLRIRNRFIIDTDNSGNLEVYDISNNIKAARLWTSTEFLNSRIQNQKLRLPFICDASGRYCITTRRYFNGNPNYGADGNPAYGLNTDGHMEFIVYDTDKNGDGSNIWEDQPKNLYLTRGFAAGYKTSIEKVDNWERDAFNDHHKRYHTTWKTTNGDTIPMMFRDNNFTVAQAFDSVRYGKQAYNFNKNPEHTYSNNPYQNQSNDTLFRANLT